MKVSTLIAAGLLALVVAGGVWLGLGLGGSDLLIVGPEQLEFSTLQIGERERKIVLVTNPSDQPIEVAAVQVAAPYRASRSRLEVGPGQTKEVLVTFEPDRSGRFASQLTLESLAFRGGEKQIPLQGAALTPAAIRVEPHFVDFGKVGVGTSVRARIGIANDGESELIVTGLSGGKPFRPEATALRVGAGSAESIEIVFTPEKERKFQKSLSIRSNDPVRERVILALQGSGVAEVPQPAISVAPDSLDFATAAECSGGKKWISIENHGSDPLDIANLSFAAPFSGPSRSRSLEPGERFNIPVFYAPSEIGRHEGELSIFSNDPEAGVFSVPLRGAGSACVASAEDLARPLVSDDGAPGSASSWLVAEDGSAAGARSGAQAGPRADGAALDPTAAADAAAAEAEADDPAATDDSPDAPASPSFVEGPGNSIRVGSYRSEISNYHVGSIEYNSASGQLAINELRLPYIDAALGEFFQFEEVSIRTRIDALGEAEMVVPITMFDPWGNETRAELRLTTGTATAILNGKVVSVTGSPLDSRGIVRFRGIMRFDDGPFAGQQMSGSFDINTQG